MDQDHPEATCKVCGGPNVSWFAPNDVWNRVVPEVSGIMCPVCFVKRAVAQGMDVTWELRPEQL